MFGNKKRKIQISKSDLKQAVLNANNLLDKKNKLLEKEIKEQERALKSSKSEFETLVKGNPSK